MSTPKQPAAKPEKATPDAAAAPEAGTTDAAHEEPAAGETVWFSLGTGEFEVEVGSQVYENLVAQGATQIPGPTTEEVE